MSDDRLYINPFDPFDVLYSRARIEHASQLRREGLTYNQIGERLGGLSRERVRCLIVKAKATDRQP